MEKKPNYLTICRVMVRLGDELLIDEIFSFAVGADPKAVVLREIRDQVAKKKVPCELGSLKVEISEEKKQAVSPILTIHLRCPECNKSSDDLGVLDEQFQFCGQCGKPTEWVLEKTKA